MPNLNKVFLIGNLTHDPETKETTNGTKLTRFGLATNRRFKKSDGTKGERVYFIDVIAWNQLAETCAQYLTKGSLVFVEGRLEYRTWEHEGEKRKKHEVQAKTVQFLSPHERKES